MLDRCHRMFLAVLAGLLLCGSRAISAEPPTTWWSLRPLTRPPVPSLTQSEANWVRTPVDAFILSKLRARGLAPSPEADRRTLIRRLSFDLIGLPPTPEEVDTFQADVRADAYELLVDRLLSSPHYGERWGRHWLDVVHYGDTHGYDKDKPRPNAWPYRDYVIRTLNADRPYSRFVQEQLAGDVLFPGTAAGVEALGFIAAGPWDFIGHAEVPESKIDGKIARHLDRDDMVANTMNTFVSLTVQCAQCHDHKFDPIKQVDYYSLQAVFAALDRADRTYYTDPILAKRAAELEERQRMLLDRKKMLDAEVAQRGGAELGEIDRQLAAATQPGTGRERPEFGYHSQIELVPDRVKWVQVDLGKSLAIDHIAYVGCFDTFNNIGAGFGFPLRYKIEISNDTEFKKGVAIVVDHTTADVPNPGVEPQSAPAGAKVARYVRMTATRLAPRLNDHIFAVAELMVFDSSGKNVALNCVVTSFDSIEAPPRWRRSNLVDGYYHGKPQGPAAAEVATLRSRRTALLERVATPQTRRELAETTSALAAIGAEHASLPRPSVVYAGTVYQGNGAFVGTGATGGKPRPIHVLARGDVRKPGAEAEPGAVEGVPGLPSQFDVPADHPEGQRRAALARWISDKRNPLTWRSIVNRVWRYHFGRGIVDSPNDFGRMGQLPTHPELLDYLAVEFRDHGQSLKQLHRLIVTSSTYRQASTTNDAYANLDAENAYLWRMNRRRLEAEAVRDSVLAVSGKLDRRPFGPGFQEFVIEKPEHSPHFQYDLHDPDDPRCYRRSVYRFLVRSQQQPFMTTLDCADPSIQVDKRNETLSALQALALLNNGFMLTMSKHFAARVESMADDVPGRVSAAFRLALGRMATEDERAALTTYARKYGMANTCRVIMNMNEFVFVD